MIVFYIADKDLSWVEEDTVGDVLETKGVANSSDVEIIRLSEKEAKPDKFDSGDYLFIARKEVAQMYKKALNGKNVKIFRPKEILIDVTDKTEEIFTWTNR
jgi:hypothetical protein